MAEIDRENLAKSHVLATFNGITERPCMAMIHPPPPPQRFADFTIHEYIEYEKFGKYGDEQSDRHGVELGKDQSEEVIGAIEALEPGELVELAWQHDYVTFSEDGGRTSSKSPMRPVYILERAPKLLLTVAQGEQGQDGSVPITLITMAGEEAANFAFDGAPQLADVRSAASEALQLHPLQLDFVDMNGAVLEDAPFPEDASAIPAEMPGMVDSAAPQPQLRASAAPEISPAAAPRAMDAPSTVTTIQPQPAASPSTLAAAPCLAVAGCMAAGMAATACLASVTQPQASPVAMAATSVAPQTRACPIVMAATSPTMFGTTAAQPQPQMRQMSMAAPVTITQPQSHSFATPGPQAYSMVMPGNVQSAYSMAPQFPSALGHSISGMLPLQQAYQMAAAPASYVAPVLPYAQVQARPVATQAAAVPAGFTIPQQRAPQQAVAPQPVVMAAAPSPYSYSMSPQLQPCQMPGAPGMIPIFAAPQQSAPQQPIYAAPQTNR